MASQIFAPDVNYMTRQESFMYDKEPKFPMHRTQNAARIEYTEKGVAQMASRRCDIVEISRSTAILSLLTNYHLPEQFYLDLPDAGIRRVGCMLIHVRPGNLIEARFLRLLNDREMNRIFVYSVHPAHRNIKLDIRS